MTHKTDITHYDVPFTVTYDFYPAQKETRIDPPYAATADVYEIRITGTEHDIAELLSDFVYDAIQTKVIEQHTDD